MSYKYSYNSMTIDAIKKQASYIIETLDDRPHQADAKNWQEFVSVIASAACDIFNCAKQLSKGGGS